MARPKAKAPALRYHLSGQSVVTIDGRDFYLGKHDTPESFARYAVLIREYQAGGLKLPADFELSRIDGFTPTAQQADVSILVRHLTASYREHVKTKYAGNATERFRLSLLCDQLLDASASDVAGECWRPLSVARLGKCLQIGSHP